MYLFLIFNILLMKKVWKIFLEAKYQNLIKNIVSIKLMNCMENNLFDFNILK